MPFPDIRRLVKERPKTAPEIVSKAVAGLQALETANRDRALDRALEQVSKYLGYMKFWLFGDEGHEPTKDNVIALAHEVVRTDFLLLLVTHLPSLDFEARKDAAQVFGAVVRIRDAAGQECPGAGYVREHAQILDMLFDGCVGGCGCFVACSAAQTTDDGSVRASERWRATSSSSSTDRHSTTQQSTDHQPTIIIIANQNTHYRQKPNAATTTRRSRSTAAACTATASATSASRAVRSPRRR